VEPSSVIRFPSPVMIAGCLCGMYRSRRSTMSSTSTGHSPAADNPQPIPAAPSSCSKHSSLPHGPQIGMDRHWVIREPAGNSGMVGSRSPAARAPTVLDVLNDRVSGALLVGVGVGQHGRVERMGAGEAADGHYAAPLAWRRWRAAADLSANSL
jgi:hypothetical protein